MTLPTMPLLTADDEVRLAQRIEAGVYADHLLNTECPSYTNPDELAAVIHDGEVAWQEFFAANLRLAAALANRAAARYDVDADDVLQECCLALGGAIRAWDWKRGTRFSTFAWPRLTMAARSFCLKRLSGGQSPDWYLRARIIAGQTDGHVAAEGQADLVAAIADKLGRPKRSVRQALAWVPPRRLSELDDVEDDNAVNPADVVWARLSRLDPASRDIVERRFGFAGKRATYNELAEDLGLPARVVKNNEAKALDRLAASLAQPLAA